MDDIYIEAGYNWLTDPDSNHIKQFINHIDPEYVLWLNAPGVRGKMVFYENWLTKNTAITKIIGDGSEDYTRFYFKSDDDLAIFLLTYG